MTGDLLRRQNGTSVLLSTVVLNWNRQDLLRKMIGSYLETVSVDFELIVVDNASTDGSREFIQALAEGRPNCYPVFLPDNLGGDALNVGLSKARGRFLHISENDIEYLPGWDRDLLAKFEAFPELGQLSIFSPFHQAARGEIWNDKPAHLLVREGIGLYAAHENVGSTSVIRREIWEKGVRWKSIASGDFKFPDDADFCMDVKKLGYLVAWNDRYVAVNWGHQIQEMAARLPYYMENYAAKSWIGIEGFRKRLREHGYDLIDRGEGGHSIIKIAEGLRREPGKDSPGPASTNER